MSCITGYCNFSEITATQEIVSAMTDVLRHRGPDDRGVFVEGPVALGHTRLAALDRAETDRQPMSTPVGLVTLVFDGAIYNHDSLRKKLAGYGHRFTSSSNTEVILSAYREWGGDCVNHFNGAFAFCIFDARKGSLFLARDRYGIKELMAEMGSWARAHHPVAVVPFFRGESLTHPQWDVLLASSYEFGLGPIQLATNASLLTKQRGRRLLEIGVDTLSFSMDTLDPQTYRTLRGSDYHTNLDNVLRFLELRSAYSGPGGCKTVQVSAVDTAKTHHGMEAFVHFGQKRADRVRIYPEHSPDGNSGSLPEESAMTPRTPAARSWRKWSSTGMAKLLCVTMTGHGLSPASLSALSVAMAFRACGFLQPMNAYGRPTKQGCLKVLLPVNTVPTGGVSR